MAVDQRKGVKEFDLQNIWIKGLPFKMAFLMWRIRKGKVPVDDNLRRRGIEGTTRYQCYNVPDQETISHEFQRSDSTNKTWSYFSYFAGINMNGISLREIILAGWNI